MDLALARRATSLAARLAPHLPTRGTVLDVGCGTGHNGAAVTARTGLRVLGLDVADLGVRGPAPTLFDGRSIPFGDGAFAAATMLFVLAFVPEPVALLREVRRVVDGRLLVVQSTFAGPWSRAVLGARSYLEGELAFAVARRAGLIAPGTPCPVAAPRPLTRFELAATAERAGWTVGRLEPEPWPLGGPSRDLWLLERAP